MSDDHLAASRSYSSPASIECTNPLQPSVSLTTQFLLDRSDVYFPDQNRWQRYLSDISSDVERVVVVCKEVYYLTSTLYERAATVTRSRLDVRDVTRYHLVLLKARDLFVYKPNYTIFGSAKERISFIKFASHLLVALGQEQRKLLCHIPYTFDWEALQKDNERKRRKSRGNTTNEAQNSRIKNELNDAQSDDVPHDKSENKAVIRGTQHTNVAENVHKTFSTKGVSVNRREHVIELIKSRGKVLKALFEEFLEVSTNKKLYADIRIHSPRSSINLIKQLSGSSFVSLIEEVEEKDVLIPVEKQYGYFNCFRKQVSDTLTSQGMLRTFFAALPLAVVCTLAFRLMKRY